MQQDTYILLFIKNPAKGTAKSRLAADLPEDVVVELYKNFILDTLETLATLSTSFSLCYTPAESIQDLTRWLGPAYTYTPQRGNNLGQRMTNSFTDAFTQGYQRVILIGSDIPDLPAPYLTASLEKLTHHDAVIGPSTDGGYYLIGFRRDTFTPTAFDQITWSSTSVLSDTLARLNQAGKKTYRLPTWTDIDTIADLRGFLEKNKDTAFKSPHTISYIQTHTIQMG